MSDNVPVNSIAKIRNARSISQEEAADAVGISLATYKDVESSKYDMTSDEFDKLSKLLNASFDELYEQPRNEEKFKQMLLYFLQLSDDGIPKTKLAKLLYLADFSNFYDKLYSMSGVQYIKREFGPVADIFFDTVDDLQTNNKIAVEKIGNALVTKTLTIDPDYGTLADEDKERLAKIYSYWRDKRTDEIVEFTHGQKPWMMHRLGEYMPYISIGQEDPNNVYAPITY